MAKSKAKVAKKSGGDIVIDPDKGLVFANEEALYKHFEKEIDELEGKYFQLRSDSDIPEEDFEAYEGNLIETLELPGEIWLDKKMLEGASVSIYVKVFESDDGEITFHVALAYLTHDLPSFIYLHFPTKDEDLVEKLRRGELVYSRALSEAPEGAIEGDALTEADELALGLYNAMLLVRSETDVPESKFGDYADIREKSVEEADEIWRADDAMGNILVNFIKDLTDEESDLFYIVVTVEDVPSSSHALLFSFPTKDKSLVERYRRGENLQAEEVVQESSH